MKKLVMFLLIVCAMYSSTFADDFDFDFGNKVSGSDVVEFDDESEKGFQLEIGGEVEYKLRTYVDLSDAEIISDPELTLNIKAKKNNSEAVAVVKFNENDDIEELYEAYLRLNYDKFSIEVGKMLVVWGKGDIRHVVDVLTDTDFSDFINVPYNERRRPVHMVKFNYFTGENGKTELVYMPFDSKVFGNDDKWFYYINPTASSGDLDKGRVALRHTNSLGGIDFGLMTQLNFGRTNWKMKENDLGDLGVFSTPLEKQRKNQYTFGGELATEILGVNTRLETTYVYSGDFEGDDPATKNDTLNILFSFDKNLPLNNMNLFFEYLGMLKMNEDKIKENVENFPDSLKSPYYLGDSEGSSYDEYQTNIIYTKLSDSYMNDKIKASFTYSYYIAGHCYSVEPQVTFSLMDNTSLELKYMEYSDDIEEISGLDYTKNDFVQVKFEYKF